MVGPANARARGTWKRRAPKGRGRRNERREEDTLAGLKKKASESKKLGASVVVFGPFVVDRDGMKYVIAIFDTATGFVQANPMKSNADPDELSRHIMAFCGSFGCSKFTIDSNTVEQPSVNIKLIREFFGTRCAMASIVRMVDFYIDESSNLGLKPFSVQRVIAFKDTLDRLVREHEATWGSGLNFLCFEVNATIVPGEAMSAFRATFSRERKEDQSYDLATLIVGRLESQSALGGNEATEADSMNNNRRMQRPDSSNGVRRRQRGTSGNRRRSDEQEADDTSDEEDNDGEIMRSSDDDSDDDNDDDQGDGDEDGQGERGHQQGEPDDDAGRGQGHRDGGDGHEGGQNQGNGQQRGPSHGGPSTWNNSWSVYQQCMTRLDDPEVPARANFGEHSRLRALLTREQPTTTVRIKNEHKRRREEVGGSSGYMGGPSQQPDFEPGAGVGKRRRARYAKEFKKEVVLYANRYSVHDAVRHFRMTHNIRLPDSTVRSFMQQFGEDELGGNGHRANNH